MNERMARFLKSTVESLDSNFILQIIQNGEN